MKIFQLEIQLESSINQQCERCNNHRTTLNPPSLLLTTDPLPPLFGGLTENDDQFNSFTVPETKILPFDALFFPPPLSGNSFRQSTNEFTEKIQNQTYKYI